MAAFHNLAIKGSILTDQPLTNATRLGMPARKIILDTSIGKGGDIGRYYNHAEFLLGVDLDAEGIRDPDEGAYRRYMDRLVDSYRARAPDIPTMVFCIGDSTKSYMDGKSGINEEEADMMRAIYGKVNPAAKVPPYIDAKCKGKLKEGVHFMYSMFSIHYYFESKEKWEGFLNNIRDSLKVGGYFMCCCFDGNRVANKLKDIEQGDAIQGVDATSGATIWRITKENTVGDILPSTPEEGFGHAIDVEFLSIGSAHREYLVSPKLLEDQLNSIGLALCTRQEALELGIPSGSMSFEDTYTSNSLYPDEYPMTNEVKEFSFLNRWFVFKRYGTAPGARVVPAEQEAAPPPPNSPDYSPASPAYNPYAPSSPPFSPSSPVYPAAQQGGPALPSWAAFGPGPVTTAWGQPQGGPGMTGSVWAAYGPGPAATAWGQQQGGPAATSAWGALEARPHSSAWNAVPLSGNLAQANALEATAGRTPPYAPGTPKYGPGTPNYGAAPNEEEEEELPPGPVYSPEMNVRNRGEAEDDWYAKQMNIRERAKAKEEARLPADLSPEERTTRLETAADLAVAAAIQRYQARERASGLVTSVVIGGARTVAVEKGAAAGPQKKYKSGEIFRFFGKAELKDSLKINDPGAARWLALSAPFPIKDGSVEYPTINHYLAGMKYKLATDKPDLAADLFSSKGTIHTKYLRLRDQIASKHKEEKEKRQVKEKEDQELLRNEAADVADAALPKTIKRYKAQFDEARWIAQKDDVLKEALRQRWAHDARFRKIVEAAKLQDKYLLYYTGSSTITSFGGIRREDGSIEGENQVGKIIMELAGYPPV